MKRALNAFFSIGNKNKLASIGPFPVEFKTVKIKYHSARNFMCSEDKACSSETSMTALA